MREILFRGKFHDKWVEGSLLYDEENNKAFIAEHFEDEAAYLREVIPETVGQYTGLTVPSGKIFEHDIVTAKFKSNGARFNFTVKYSTEKGGFVFDNGHIKVPFDDIRSVRIIGNIHDNPELLKGE